MNNKSNVSVEISEDLVRPIIEAKIHAAIAREMAKDRDDLLEKLVQGAMVQKCNTHGQVSQYSYDNNTTFIEVITKQAIQNAAREAMREFMADNTTRIKELVKKEFSKKQATLAKAMVDGMVENMKSDYRFTVDCKFETPKNY